jgi:hypothetical protein
MSDYLKSVLATGRKILSDTKSPKKPLEPDAKPGKTLLPVAAGSPPEKDPHKIFVRRAIKEKMKKSELVAEVQKFCDEADSKL